MKCVQIFLLCIFLTLANVTAVCVYLLQTFCVAIVQTLAVGHLCVCVCVFSSTSQWTPNPPETSSSVISLQSLSLFLSPSVCSLRRFRKWWDLHECFCSIWDILNLCGCIFRSVCPTPGESQVSEQTLFLQLSCHNVCLPCSTVQSEALFFFKLRCPVWKNSHLGSLQKWFTLSLIAWSRAPLTSHPCDSYCMSLSNYRVYLRGTQNKLVKKLTPKNEKGVQHYSFYRLYPCLQSAGLWAVVSGTWPQLHLGTGEWKQRNKEGKRSHTHLGLLLSQTAAYNRSFQLWSHLYGRHSSSSVVKQVRLTECVFTIICFMIT